MANLFYYEGQEQEADIVLEILTKLLQIEGFAEQLTLLLMNSSETVFSLKSPMVKKYLIKFIQNNLDQFYKEDFLYQLIKVYLRDQNSGVYEETSKLLFSLVSCSTDYKFKQHITDLNFFKDLIEYLESVRGDDSTLLVRETEILIAYLNMEESEFAESVLMQLVGNFFIYDLLTQLVILDSFEKKLEKPELAEKVISHLNIFQKLSQGQEIPNEILRKLMYTISKLYGGKILKNLNLMKNFLAVSLQHFAEDKSNTDFITSILFNTLHNKEIFTFLMDPTNSTQFDFFQGVIRATIESYASPDAKAKMHALDLVELVFDFNIYSAAQEQFVKHFLEAFFDHFNARKMESENEGGAFLMGKLYKDFKTHDFDDYELKFLQTVFSLISHQKFLKLVINHFDLILYLLNRRTRPEKICKEKYKIIQDMFKTDYFSSGKVDEGLVKQFSNYIVRGLY